jgi:putative tricarboxylic transport membrane protein
MRFSDSLTGLVLLLLGVSTVALAQTFPPVLGQGIGPSLFPSLLGGGLAIAGAGLAAAGLRQSGPWVVVDADLGRPRMALNLAIVVGGLMGYAAIVERVGFFLTSGLLLAVLLRVFGVGAKLTTVLSVAVPLVLHYAFYSVLRVPLPWGVLEGMAW